MNEFERMLTAIQKLALSVETDDEVEVFAQITRQLDRAARARWSREELETYLKIENDVLDGGAIAVDSLLWHEIRNIQDSIIEYFGDYYQRKNNG